MSAVPVSNVKSPCTNVCKMHPPSGWCEGCARTVAEITAWSKADDATRSTILARLPERRAILINQGILAPAVPKSRA